MPRHIEQIYGYVDLTPEMRAWKKKQIAGSNGKPPNMHLARGWRIFPAHSRENPTTAILLRGYPDTSDSHYYVFDDPDNRDQYGQLIEGQPLPIKTERDKQYFREQNQEWMGHHGFAPYKIFHHRKNLIEAYAPETFDDAVETSGKFKGMRADVASNVGPEETPVMVPVLASETGGKRIGRPPGSKNKNK